MRSLAQVATRAPAANGTLLEGWALAATTDAEASWECHRCALVAAPGEGCANLDDL
eukprot:CAMPEP_0114259596 /NCGR_PEP_ID=MMETSP0058-20121206/19979_1 /TAXON_ID=36894 /ORGANISM="Pyramimonas parkeae, CCMP726" /LENGTH=55 /DNA_ID=CAMNT_0001374657 /DNA_START=186 /DNA_END=353 /DNA_ORIENTATION=-